MIKIKKDRTNLPPMLKKIPGFSNYFADLKGNIYSKGAHRGLFLRKLKGSEVYRDKSTKKIRIYGLTDANGKKHTVKGHRMIAKTWIPNPYNKPQVNHLDGDPLNNEVSNLQWATNKENHQHAKENHLDNRHGSRKGKPNNVQLDIFKASKQIQAQYA